MRFPILRRSSGTFALIPALFLLPLSLDFKGGDAGGSAWQYLVVALSALGWVLHFTLLRFLAPRGRFWQVCNWAIVWTLGGSLISLAINGTDLGNYARVFLAIVLFAMGFYFASSMARCGKTETMNRLVELGCAVSAVFTIFTGFMVTGQDIGEIRYQILSPALLLFEAMLLHNIFMTHIRPRLSKLLLLGCIAIQLVSVTRSALLALVIIFAAALWISSRSIPKLLGRTAIFAPIGAVLLGTVVMVAALVSPQLLDRWNQRIFVGQEFGFDPTTISRVAEIKEQVDRWSSTPTSVLVGQGFGASYGWSKDLFDVLLDTKAFQLDRIDEEHFYFGHNYWVSSLFSGGLLFGLAIPAALIYATFVGLRTSRRLIRSREDEAARFQISRATLILVATISMTIGGNPFAYRYPSLIAGVALGALVVWRRSLIERSTPPMLRPTQPFDPGFAAGPMHH